MKSRLLVTILLLSVVLLLSAAVLIRQSPQEAFLEKRAALIVREIGHRLLQKSGDFTSRVLPIKQLSKGIFQIKFQSEFSFMPDTLVKIVRSNLASSNLPLGYMVNVFDCASNEIVYGFEISPQHQEIVPCLGRVQPKGCYSIQIAFIDLKASSNSSNYFYLYAMAAMVITLVAFVGRAYFEKGKNSYRTKIGKEIKIGKYLFSIDNRFLTSGLERIELSDKESKLLGILAAAQNQLISRDELLKKVWEDDGVFTGRSLDMFISKLRKKLRNDSATQIINIHGKGYKLEIKPEVI